MKKDLLEKKIFKDTIRILKKNSVPFWLDSGTLLGIVRDNKSIAWHNKIDIAIPGEFYNKFMALQKQFFP
ncbi:MAG: LicD family protein, partial [Candidatus Marinimicrobia bacterium]|nr:LicD family protein [bacterium]MCG2715463.1 LicD family protein [Candidatus Neomarinimicrobiota bacterium]